MSNKHLAEFIATAILANCNAHLNGRKSRADWHPEQYRLWGLAIAKRVQTQVARLTTPSLAASKIPPPYSVRKQVRDATLAVGR